MYLHVLTFSYPIRCHPDTVELAVQALGCASHNFPIYLGLPLSAKRLTMGCLKPWIEKIAHKLPGWKAGLLNLAGRCTLIKSVLSAIPVYLLVALNVPKWCIKAIDKIRRSFLWKGKRETRGGNCLITWDKIVIPIDLGGLGVPDLLTMSWALQLRWLWLGVVMDHNPNDSNPILKFYLEPIVTPSCGSRRRSLLNLGLA
jgi:hypothetical protein